MSGPAEGEGLGELQPPHFFGNFKELLRKRCFQPPLFESLFAPPPPPTFKVAPRALDVLICCGVCGSTEGNGKVLSTGTLGWEHEYKSWEAGPALGLGIKPFCQT